MNRLAICVPLPMEAQQIADALIDAEGTCTCGKIMQRIEAKLVLMTAAPSQNKMIAAAYCLPCAAQINKTLKALRNVRYFGNTETAPIEHGRQG